MKSIFASVVAIMLWTNVCAAQGPALPDVPSVVLSEESFAIERSVAVETRSPQKVKPIDMKFATLAIISTGTTFADSYTTLFARENWLAGKKGVCNAEVQSAYLYGTHPTVGRAYGVASAKSAASILAAYYLRKHHHKFWSMPLVANSVISLEGVTQNISACN